MRKRLKKKKRVGPYQDLCFPVTLTANPHGEHDWDRFFSEFADFLRSRGLPTERAQAAGDRLLIQVGPRGAGAAEKRHAIIQWLESRPELAATTPGQLTPAR